MKFVAFIFFFFALTGAARADLVNLVTGNGYPPFTDKTLPQGGLITALVRQAFVSVGTDVDIAFRPWKRGYVETLKGIQDGTFPYIKNENRLQEMMYSEAILKTSAAWFFNADNVVPTVPDSFHNTNSINGFRGMFGLNKAII